MGATQFMTKWRSVEDAYDAISGYPGAMAEDLKDEEDLNSAISELVQDQLIMWDPFTFQYNLTEKGKNRAKENMNDDRAPIQETSLSLVPKQSIIHQFEQEYPALAIEFKRIQEEQYRMFCAKMLSYGLYNISVGTNLENENEKHLALTGIWFRSADKIQRLKQLLLLKQDNPLKDEPIEDAWKDLSVYSIISQIVNNGKWRKGL